MSDIKHQSIGMSARKVEIEDETKTERRKEIVARFNETPWHKYGLDQLSVWVLWFTLMASLFLFCTVKAVVLAVR